MSRRAFGLTVLFVSVLMVLGTAQISFAQRRSPYIQTPYGTMDTRSAAYRMSGGNPDAYFAIQMQQYQQKAMMQEYQQLQKQQQAFQKWYADQKAKKAKGQKTDPAFDKLEKDQDAAQAAADAAKTKKKDTVKDRLKKRRNALKKRLEKAESDKKDETAKSSSATPEGAQPAAAESAQP